jgi:transketolase
LIECKDHKYKLMEENIKKIIEGKVSESEQLPTRKGFGEGLLLLGKTNSRVVVLCADLTDSTYSHLFKEAYPDRFFEMGVSEQNMASVASGMAAMGKIPFIASYAMFSPGRNWEQIRTTIAYNDVPVKIIGAHAGVSVGPDGGTHQALEDVAIMRTMPNMTVIVPCDAIEAKKATLAIAETGKPAYMRLFREKSPVITDEKTPFAIGVANKIYSSSVMQSKNIGIIANGEMVSRALLCVKEIESLGISVSILNLHTVKPLDAKGIKEFVSSNKNILTIEEHQIAGGMGSAVLEFLAKENLLKDLNFQMIGVEDRFGQSGTKEELFKEYGLDEKSILSKAKEMF